MRYFLVLPLLFLVGCTGNQIRQQEPKASKPPEVIIKEADGLVAGDNLAGAVKMLKSAVGIYPENRELEKRFRRLDVKWERHKRQLEDRILVLEAGAIWKKLPLLEKLAQSDPDSYILESRLLFWKKLLESKEDNLISCAGYHLKKNLLLAKECVELARKIDPGFAHNALIKEIDHSLQVRKSIRKSKIKEKKKQHRLVQIDQLLETAKERLSTKDYAGGVRALDKLLKLAPKNPEAIKLHVRAKAERDQQVTELVKLGDRLYREEQIEQAVIIWEIAAKLDPGENDIANKIDRALKVLGRLQEIRER